MKLQQFEREEQVTVQVVDADGHVEHVVDLGAGAGGATVDVVGDTAIVTHGEDQYDLSLPAGDAEAFIHNGVLTITMEDSA
jgi:hypothetical protein